MGSCRSAKASPLHSLKSVPFIEAMIAGIPKGVPLTMNMPRLILLLVICCCGHGFVAASAFATSAKESPSLALRGGLRGLPVALNELDPNWWEATTSTAPSEANQTDGAPASGLETANFTNIFTVNTEVFTCTPFVNMPGTFMATPEYWQEQCKSIPSSATFISITIGAITDYFRPEDGSTMCDMLTSSTKHEWSEDGTTWFTPSRAVNAAGQPYALGGSGKDYPATARKGLQDKRIRLPFWGVLPATTSTGGCCAEDYQATTESWSLPFKMAYCGTPKRLDPVCTPAVAVAGNTLANQAFWTEECKKVPVTASYVKVVMGDFVDYFRPVATKTYCDMLTSSDAHEWSNDRNVWVTPTSSDAQFLGGSQAKLNSADSRAKVSFWGSTGAQNGGCCFRTAGAAEAWGQAFIMSYCEVPTLPPIAAMVTSMRKTEVAVANLEVQLEGLHSRLLDAEKISVDAAGNVSLARQGMYKLAAKFKDEAAQMKEVQSIASLSNTRLSNTGIQLKGFDKRVRDDAKRLASAAHVANVSATPQALQNLQTMSTEMWNLMNPDNEDGLDATEDRIRSLTDEERAFKAKLREDVKSVMVTRMRRSVQKFRNAIMKLGSVANARNTGNLGDVEGGSSLGDDIGFSD